MTPLRCIDLFAGLGGMSEGARLAGAHVLWAANHWPAAVAAHAANHPEVDHACQDLQQANWSRTPAHDLLLASPACQGHSPARGKDQPHHDDDRSTAYAVLAAVNYHRPRFVLVENVPAFRKWDGYPGWRLSLECFGYQVTEQVLDSADFGVPQSRARLFVLGARNGPLSLCAPGRPHVPAQEVIDWQAPRWQPVARPGRSPQTLCRVEAGRRDHGNRFLVPYYKSARGGRSVYRPIGTLTTRARYGVVDGERMRMLTLAESREFMGFPPGYLLPGPCVTPRGEKLSRHEAGVWMLGNAVPPPVVAELVRQIQEVA